MTEMEEVNFRIELAHYAYEKAFDRLERLILERHRLRMKTSLSYWFGIKGKHLYEQ